MLIEPELALAVVLARGIAAVVIRIWRVACRNDLIQSADPEDHTYVGTIERASRAARRRFHLLSS